MMAKGRPALFGALVCFAVFFANVVTGAMGAPVFLGDVAEMLALFAAVLFFVAGVLLREAAAGRDDRNDGENRDPEPR